MTLNDFLLAEIFTFLLVFCRLGSAIMVLPGFGEAYVSMRVRLLFALMFSLLLTPAIHNIPPFPLSYFDLANLLLSEILIGLFIGIITRFLISAISIAGMIIAYQSSLATAMVQDITSAGAAGGQGSILSNFLGLSALVLIFATGLHHMMLQVMAESYDIFKMGDFPLITDFTVHAIETINASFELALQLAAPHIAIGLIIYLAGGIIGRLMPTFQVFFVIVAPNLLISFFVLMLSFNGIMLVFLDYFRENLLRFAGVP